MNQDLDVIQIENQNYVVADKISYQGNQYFLLTKINGEEVIPEESIVVREENGTVQELTDTTEIDAIKKILEEKLKEAN